MKPDKDKETLPGNHGVVAKSPGNSGGVDTKSVDYPVAQIMEPGPLGVGEPGIAYQERTAGVTVGSSTTEIFEAPGPNSEDSKIE